jgi:DNA-binding NarL/FixJ family response regulator
MTLHALIADDHAIIRIGLRDVLEREFTDLIVGEAKSSAEVLQKVRETKWQLLLLDIIMPGSTVVETLQQVRELDAEVRILVLTALPESEYVAPVLRAGANGYMTKQCAPEEMLHAIHKVLDSGFYLTDEGIRALAAGRGAEAAVHDRLSGRELEVLKLVARGRAIKGIAEDLHVSEKTVATYITRIREKTDLHSYVEMTRYALRHGLVG